MLFALPAGTQSLPEGPCNQYMRLPVPKTMPSMVFGTRVLEYWVLGPSGTDVRSKPSAGSVEVEVYF